MTADFEYEVEDHKARYLRESLEMPKGKRWSDKARETLALSDAMTSSRRKAFNDLNDLIREGREEVAIWHEVRNNLRFVSKRVDNDSMNMAVEAKVTRNFTITGTGNTSSKPVDAVSDKFVKELEVVSETVPEPAKQPYMDENFDPFLETVPVAEEKVETKILKDIPGQTTIVFGEDNEPTTFTKSPDTVVQGVFPDDGGPMQFVEISVENEKKMEEYCKSVGIEDPNEEVPF
jgi:hypothetical protein